MGRYQKIDIAPFISAPIYTLLLLNQPNLNCFQMQRFSSCAGTLARFYPVQPTLTLHVCSIDNVIMLGEITRQFYFNSLNSKRLPCSAGNLAILDPFLPADILNVSSILDAARLPKVRLANRQRLNSKVSASCANGHAFVNRRLPTKV